MRKGNCRIEVDSLAPAHYNCLKDRAMENVLTQHIEITPGVRGGQPCLAGTRMAVAVALRGHGIDVTTTVEAGLRKADDLAHLSYAASEGSALAATVPWQSMRK
jgi:uncharacterized protein (DUF433 family)